MKIRATLISAGLVAAMLNPAFAEKKQKAEQKFCDALEAFSVDLSKLDEISPTSTVAELRSAANKVSKDADKVEKEAKKIKTPTAKQFSESAKQLRSEVQGLQGNMTLEQAKTRIADDIENVRTSGKALAQDSGCPSAVPDMPAKQDTQSKDSMQPKQEPGGMEEQQK